jgi:hypothetical protein
MAPYRSAEQQSDGAACGTKAERPYVAMVEQDSSAIAGKVKTHHPGWPAATGG